MLIISFYDLICRIKSRNRNLMNFFLLDLLTMEFRRHYLRNHYRILMEDLTVIWATPLQLHQPRLITHLTWEDHGYLEVKCTNPYSVPPLVEVAVLEEVQPPAILPPLNLTLQRQHLHLPPQAPISTIEVFNSTNSSNSSSSI